MFLKIWISIKIRSVKNLFVFKLTVLALIFIIISIIEHKTQQSTKETKSAKINAKLSIRI